MRPSRERVARVAGLRSAVVGRAGDLRGAERDGLLHHRRAAVINVARRAGAQALRYIVVAGDLLDGRVGAVNRDADRLHDELRVRLVRHPLVIALGGDLCGYVAAIPPARDQTVGGIDIGAGWPVASGAVTASA